MKKFFCLGILSLIFIGCSTESKEAPVTGNPYELIVVTEPSILHGAVGDTLKTILGEQVQGISRVEPLFDMFSVAPNAMKTLVQKHRNLVFVNVGEKFGVNEMYADTNKFAKGQLCIYFQGPNSDTLSKYIYENRAVLTGLLNKYERDRFVKRVTNYNEAGLETLIKNKFDFSMKIPKGYVVKQDSDNFLWLSFETTYGSLGIVIYTFSQEPNGENWIIEQRDLAVGKIPGPSEGAFMTTEKRIPSQTVFSNINGRQWYQTRGLWAVDKDFMGGPYISFVTFAKGKYYAIDCFVQEPDVNRKHRNFIRQFESLPLTVKFNDETK